MSQPDPADGPEPDAPPQPPSAAEVAAEVEQAELAAAEAEEARREREEDRRYPSTIGGVFYLVILLAMLVGLVIVWQGDWRLGVRWLGGALLTAAFLRLVLPRRDAGMLAVRHRLVDCVLLSAIGGVILFLADTIPNQPGL